MKKTLASILLATTLTGFTLADTLYHRNGSVLKGNLIGYDNGEFIFEITSGDDRNRGRRLRFPARDVIRIEIDRAGDGDSAPSPGGRWTELQPIEVQLVDQWIRTNVEVRRDQRVRIEAAGQIYLDGRFASGPDGINRRDPNSPLPDQRDGALIAAIGSEADSRPILIGRSKEFAADRDGRLYFTANHWDTDGARGAYNVRIWVETSGGGNRGPLPPVPVPSRGQGEQTVSVSATNQWTDTGIDVEPGMRLEISANGTIVIGNNFSTDPDGNQAAKVATSIYPLPSAGVGALIGKIRYRDGRESRITLIGSDRSLTIDPRESGRLFLGVNDDYLRDNRGAFNVRVRW